MSARYEGLPVIVDLLEDGRLIKLRSPLVFHDAAGLAWSVPVDAIADGASIPWIFWSVVGSPLTGPYRDASIVHDWYCDVRTRSWQATHRTFYDAMIVSGVEETLAKILYYAVLWRGPRWEERVSHNVTLGDGSPGIVGLSTAESFTLPETEIVEIERPGSAASETEQAEALAQITALFEAENPSLDAIEALAEQPLPG